MSFGIDDAVAAVASIGGKLIDRLWPDPAQAAQAKIELLKMQQSGELAQLTAEADLAKAQAAINQVEAGSSDLFVAGWRPFIGWACGAALIYSFILVPVGMWVGFVIGKPIPKPPVLDDHLWELMFGMLGLGGMRTMEKLKGIRKQS